MAQTYKRGIFDRDDMVGVPESVSALVGLLWSKETPFLTAVGGDAMSSLQTPCRDTVHYYYEEQWRPMRTTLNGALDASTQTVVLADEAGKPGEIIVVDEESILLGTTSDYKTFASCGRSVGTPAAAAHLTGAAVLIMGKPWEIGSAAGTPDMIVQPNRVTNYTQIAKRNVGVSGTAAVLAEHHRDGRSRYDVNVEQNVLNIKHEVENDLLFGIARAPVGDTTAGKMDGVIERLYSANSTNMSGTTPTRDHIRTILRAIRDYGGGSMRKMFFVSDYFKGVIDDWQLPHRQVVAGSEMEKRYGSNVSEVELGGELIPIVPMTKLKTHALMITPEMIGIGPLSGPGGTRDLKHTLLGIDGDRIQGELVCELTNEVRAPNAHHLLYGMASP